VLTLPQLITHVSFSDYDATASVPGASLAAAVQAASPSLSSTIASETMSSSAGSGGRAQQGQETSSADSGGSAQQGQETVTLTVIREGVLNAVVVWFDLHMDAEGQDVLSNAPPSASVEVALRTAATAQVAGSTTASSSAAGSDCCHNDSVIKGAEHDNDQQPKPLSTSSSSCYWGQGLQYLDTVTVVAPKMSRLVVASQDDTLAHNLRHSAPSQQAGGKGHGNEGDLNGHNEVNDTVPDEAAAAAEESQSTGCPALSHMPCQQQAGAADGAAETEQGRVTLVVQRTAPSSASPCS
jgi:hypothetical protein